MSIAVDIKTMFPDLDVFDYDNTAYVKKLMYKDETELMEMRIEEKAVNGLLSSSKEYWVTNRMIVLRNLPEMPLVRNEGTDVVGSKIGLYKKIEKMLSYARSI